MSIFGMPHILHWCWPSVEVIGCRCSYLSTGSQAQHARGTYPWRFAWCRSSSSQSSMRKWTVFPASPENVSPSSHDLHTINLCQCQCPLALFQLLLPQHQLWIFLVCSLNEHVWIQSINLWQFHTRLAGEATLVSCKVWPQNQQKRGLNFNILVKFNETEG